MFLPHFRIIVLALKIEVESLLVELILKEVAEVDRWREERVSQGDVSLCWLLSQALRVWWPHEDLKPPTRLVSLVLVPTHARQGFAEIFFVGRLFVIGGPRLLVLHHCLHGFEGVPAQPAALELNICGELLLFEVDLEQPLHDDAHAHLTVFADGREVRRLALLSREEFTLLPEQILHALAHAVRREAFGIGTGAARAKRRAAVVLLDMGRPSTRRLGLPLRLWL
eukprot:scaffold104961_cov23-Tisochrysis_lutea.AAC.1